MSLFVCLLFFCLVADAFFLAGKDFLCLSLFPVVVPAVVGAANPPALLLLLLCLLLEDRVESEFTVPDTFLLLVIAFVLTIFLEL